MLQTIRAVWIVWLTGIIIPSGDVAAPPNDNFGLTDLGSPRSISVEGMVSRATRQIGDTSGANKEESEPDHGGSGLLGKTEWFEWTAPETHPVEIATSGFSNLLAVYTGDQLDQLEEITRGVGEPMRFRASAATRYLIAAASTDGVEFDLSIRRRDQQRRTDAPLPSRTLRYQAAPASPGNDDFARHTDLGAAASRRGCRIHGRRHAPIRGTQPCPRPSPDRLDLVEEVSVRLDYRLQRKPGLFVRIVVRPSPF